VCSRGTTGGALPLEAYARTRISGSLERRDRGRWILRVSGCRPVDTMERADQARRGRRARMRALPRGSSQQPTCRRDADDLTAAARRMPHSARCPRGKARAYCGRARPQRCCREGRCIVAQSFRPLDQRCWHGPARETRPMYVGGCTFWVQAPQRSGLGARATRFQTSPDSGERSSGVRGVKLSPWVPNHGDRRRYGAMPVLARG
jgi:hypothetical protein